MDDVKERLTREAAAPSPMAIEHRHRYGLGASLLGGLRVLELGCGAGAGTLMLAETARSVHGVDSDPVAIGDAAANADGLVGVSFAIDEPLQALLQDDVAERYDAVVCFAGLEALPDLDATLDRLRELADAGMTMILSAAGASGRAVEEADSTPGFSWEETLERLGAIPGATVLAQYLAEGSLVCGAESADAELDGRVVLADRHEPEFADHYIACVGVIPGNLEATLQVAAAPVSNRYLRSLERANAELRVANRRLARRRLGKADSSAGTLVAKYEQAVVRIEELEAELERIRAERDDLARNREEWILRCNLAEEKVIDLEPRLAATQRRLAPLPVRVAAKLSSRR